ncbi:nuclease-related domain-containing protein [Pseudactinotalea sp. HY160]|uniref:nuclease-related domain-containing protein n=1 Tax=Pseudactinotalea sp. HY160 TaxID=2654490 RepID=UPI00188330D4|nr:nuclease-related domain-containing protein [Pseudactinotalea sp. HY160]
MTRQPLPRGEVIGEAAFGLEHDSSWAANAEVAAAGARGERRTAKALGELAARPGGPAVLHDVAIPIPGFTANIDHVLVSGRTVVLLDSKSWKPGFYWTLAGTSRRGRELFAHADNQTMAMAYQSISRRLAARADTATATVAQPLVLVWPSKGERPVHTWALRPPGARAVPARVGLRMLSKRSLQRNADPSVVACLVPLVASLRARTE